MERKYQRLINVASTEVRMINQKQVESLKVTQDTIKNLVKKATSPRVINNIARIDALEANSVHSGMGFEATSSITPPSDVAKLDNRMKALEKEAARNR